MLISLMSRWGLLPLYWTLLSMFCLEPLSIFENIFSCSGFGKIVHRSVQMGKNKRLKNQKNLSDGSYPENMKVSSFMSHSNVFCLLMSSRGHSLWHTFQVRQQVSTLCSVVINKVPICFVSRHRLLGDLHCPLHYGVRDPPLVPS